MPDKAYGELIEIEQLARAIKAEDDWKTAAFLRECLLKKITADTVLSIAAALRQLDEEVRALRAALEPIARVLEAAGDDTDVPDGATLTNSNVMASMLFYGDLRRARQALKEPSHG